MTPTAQFILTLGGILLLGLLTSTLGRKTFLPRVTLLLLFGILIGKEGFDIIPGIFSERFEIIADLALLMVGFLLGGKLTFKSLNNSTNKILWISVSASITSMMFVSLGLIWFGVVTEVAILLGCIAAATAPAATLDVVIESESKTIFSTLLLSIVALDDAWALILFSFGIAIVTSLNGSALEYSPFLIILKDVGGAILLGFILGLPAAYLTGRIKQGQPILTEALGLVFLCGGIAIWLEVSFLIASMIMGAVIANFAKHHEYPFHAIEGIESTFMVIFFVLAGSSLEVSAIQDMGLIGAVYILYRILGKIIGANIGSQLSKTDRFTKTWMGAALLPQAGVAIGMALVAANHFPEYRQILLSVVISTTVFFELLGPIITRFALKKAEQER